MAPAIVDGRRVEAEQATIPVTDPGLLRGDGAFEVLRLYGGRPFALDDHLGRMGHTAAGLRLDVDLDALRADAVALAEAAEGADACVRLVVTRSGTRIALLEPLPPREGPTTLATVEEVPSRLLTGLKTLSYAANMLATRIAAERGADEALLVTPHGRLLEGPTSTVLLGLPDGRPLVTPPLEDRVLDSITRRRLIGLGLVEERVLTRDDLATAVEVALASTTREVQAVVRVDDRAYEAGERTRQALEAFRGHVRAEVGP